MSISSSNSFAERLNSASSAKPKTAGAKACQKIAKTVLGLLVLAATVGCLAGQNGGSPFASPAYAADAGASTRSDAAAVLADARLDPIPESTKNRTALAPNLAKGTTYYTDEDGTHLTHPLHLEAGMIEFYEKTGVKPYLYVLSEDSPAASSMEKFIEEGVRLYDELFDDQAHLLILYHAKDGHWTSLPFLGRYAHTVMDGEARAIFSAYLKRNKLASDSLDDVFSSTLSQTADCIMSEIPESAACAPAITASTVKRKALPVSSTENVEYYTDEQGDFFQDPQKLVEGMSEFYAKTGVRPYIYVPPKNLLGSSEELESLMRQKYDEVTGEGEPVYFVTCIVNPTEVGIKRLQSTASKQIMDEDADAIFTKCFYLYSNDLSKLDEGVLAETFVKTANRIMSASAEPEPTSGPAQKPNSESAEVLSNLAIICACIAGFIIVIVVLSLRRKRRNAIRTIGDVK